MGTCVGKRNLKYFLSFLLMTGVHAVVTAIICGAYFAAVTVNIDTFDSERSLERNIGLLSVGVGLYAAVIGATLICFFLYSLRLMLNNITSNEHLRTRWNSKHAKHTKKRYDRLCGKPNESMTPEELEQHTEAVQDKNLRQQREPTTCQKISYMFCKHRYPSYMETYLQLKKEGGRSADYSSVSNDAILRAYGIILPEHLIREAAEENNQLLTGTQEESKSAGEQPELVKSEE